MAWYRIETTQRIVTIQADSPEGAKGIFLRKQSPPESMPPFGSEEWSSWADRWPVLAWAHGECLMGLIEEVPEHSPTLYYCDWCGQRHLESNESHIG